MRILISPAKQMIVDTDSFAIDALPQFLPQTEQLLQAMRALAPAALQAIWKCSDSLAAQNFERLAQMDLQHGLTPALLAYDGIQYRCMAPGVFEYGQYDYLREHLRILSGFYGLLRPFDGVAPYRLEMQAKLSVGGSSDLYAFWGGHLAAQLTDESGLLINLASREYSEAVRPYLPASVRFVTCRFAERRGSRLIEKGMPCKMARGWMVRWMAENRIDAPEALRAFDERGYRFSPADSNEDQLVFLKGEN